jgi:hypothetical protein
VQASRFKGWQRQMYTLTSTLITFAKPFACKPDMHKLKSKDVGLPCACNLSLHSLFLGSLQASSWLLNTGT